MSLKTELPCGTKCLRVLIFAIFGFFPRSAKKKMFPQQFPLLAKVYKQTSHAESCWCHLFKTRKTGLSQRQKLVPSKCKKSPIRKTPSKISSCTILNIPWRFKAGFNYSLIIFFSFFSHPFVFIILPRHSPMMQRHPVGKCLLSVRADFCLETTKLIKKDLKAA